MNISEDFLSIQGEGRYAGTRAVFLRLQYCNLMCGGCDTRRVKDKYNQSEFVANQSPDAKWTCDTIAVWLRGKPYTSKQLHSEWQEKGYTEAIEKGAHIVLTGGEPLLQQSDKDLTRFLSRMKDEHNAYIEIETNGTIQPKTEFNKLIDWYNCSPKLSNTGMSLKNRLKPEVVDFIKQQPHCFKFVVYDEADLIETEKEFIKPFLSDDIPNIYLMPACDNREEHIRVSKGLVELCNKYGYEYSPRLQVAIWNKTTGV